MKQSAFLAWVFRMPLIKRWGLMHCVKNEDVAQHSQQVAVVAHLLVVIKNTRYGGSLSPEKAATIAMFHEVSETRLQDANHIIKYHNKEYTKEYKKLELMAEKECLATLPSDLRHAYADLIIQDNVDPEYHVVVKCADWICAYIKTLDELKFGNVEFDHVRINLEEKMDVIRKKHPEVNDCLNYFTKNCLVSIDELSC
jgi:5'-deoxynucleotidase